MEAPIFVLLARHDPHRRNDTPRPWVGATSPPEDRLARSLDHVRDRGGPGGDPRGEAQRPRGGARDATDGPVLGVLVTLAVPIVATNVFQSLYQLIDTFWVGRLGADAVAAVSLSFPISFLMISAGGGLSIAGAILVAQTFGAGEQRATDHAAGQTLLVVGVVSAILSVSGYLLSGPMVAFFQPTETVSRMAVDYLQVTFLGLVAVFVYFVFQALLRGVGDVKTPLVIVGGPSC
jgi:Na+-driven multidrug efflux pump